MFKLEREFLGTGLLCVLLLVGLQGLAASTINGTNPSGVGALASSQSRCPNQILQNIRNWARSNNAFYAGGFDMDRFMRHAAALGLENGVDFWQPPIQRILGNDGRMPVPKVVAEFGAGYGERFFRHLIESTSVKTVWGVERGPMQVNYLVSRFRSTERTQVNIIEGDFTEPDPTHDLNADIIFVPFGTVIELGPVGLELFAQSLAHAGKLNAIIAIDIPDPDRVLVASSSVAMQMPDPSSQVLELTIQNPRVHLLQEEDDDSAEDVEFRGKYNASLKQKLRDTKANLPDDLDTAETLTLSVYPIRKLPNAEPNQPERFVVDTELIHQKLTQNGYLVPAQINIGHSKKKPHFVHEHKYLPRGEEKLKRFWRFYRVARTVSP